MTKRLIALFCSASFLGKIAMIISALTSLFCIAGLLWHFVLVMYYKYLKRTHTNVALLDVASLYPNSIIQLNLFGEYTNK